MTEPEVTQQGEVITDNNSIRKAKKQIVKLLVVKIMSKVIRTFAFERQTFKGEGSSCVLDIKQPENKERYQ